MSYLAFYFDQMSYSTICRIDELSYSTNCRVDEMVFDEMSWKHQMSVYFLPICKNSLNQVDRLGNKDVAVNLSSVPWITLRLEGIFLEEIGHMLKLKDWQ